jgi:hypothetical protein
MEEDRLEKIHETNYLLDLLDREQNLNTTLHPISRVSDLAMEGFICPLELEPFLSGSLLRLSTSMMVEHT